MDRRGYLSDQREQPPAPRERARLPLTIANQDDSEPVRGDAEASAMEEPGGGAASELRVWLKACARAVGAALTRARSRRRGAEKDGTPGGRHALELVVREGPAIGASNGAQGGRGRTREDARRRSARRKEEEDTRDAMHTHTHAHAREGAGADAEGRERTRRGRETRKDARRSGAARARCTHTHTRTHTHTHIHRRRRRTSGGRGADAEEDVCGRAEERSYNARRRTRGGGRARAQEVRGGRATAEDARCSCGARRDAHAHVHEHTCSCMLSAD